MAIHHGGPGAAAAGPLLSDRELEAWLERAMRTPHQRPEPEPVVHDLDD